MRVGRLWGLIIISAVGGLACKERPGPSSTASSSVTSAQACPVSGEIVQVEADGHWLWQVRFDACLGDARGQGEARVRGESTGEDSPVHALARARAWTALSRQLAVAGRPGDALVAARRGLAALGDRYASSQVVDDTALKLAAAEDQVTTGRLPDAVTTLLRVMDARQKMFLALHQSSGLE